MERGNNRNPRRKYDEADLITLPTGHKVLRDEFMKLASTSSRNPNKPERVYIDKLPAISGSIAGTSSRFLEEFRRIQQKDHAREAEFALEEKAARELEEFESRRDERQRKLQDEAAKKRERRQKRRKGGYAPSTTHLPGSDDDSSPIAKLEPDDDKLPSSPSSVISPPPPTKPAPPVSRAITIIKDEE